MEVAKTVDEGCNIAVAVDMSCILSPLFDNSFGYVKRLRDRRLVHIADYGPERVILLESRVVSASLRVTKVTVRSSNAFRKANLIIPALPSRERLNMS